VPTAETSGPYSVEVPQISEASGTIVEVNSPLAGAHQQRNVALAIAAAVELAAHHGFPITPAAIENGIRRTRWPGRLERISRSNVEWILDVAHNPAGAWALRAGTRSTLEAHSPRVLIFSCLRDKPLSEMAQILFPLFDQVIVVPIRNARAASVDDLLSAAAATGTPADAAESVSEALRIAEAKAVGGLAVVSGSVYLVGEARTLLLGTAKS
jgi:dihydrofolate synthase/folylpolyglutamate synthase